MAARKRKRKSTKKSRKKGRKKGARRSGTAKRGASRTTLRAGLVVTGKPNKRTLKAKCLKAKPVGKTSTGKKVYKIESSKSCVAAKMTVKQARALLVKEGVTRPTKKQINEKVRVARAMKKLGRAIGAKAPRLQYQSTRQSHDDAYMHNAPTGYA